MEKLWKKNKETKKEIKNWGRMEKRRGKGTIYFAPLFRFAPIAPLSHLPPLAPFVRRAHWTMRGQRFEMEETSRRKRFEAEHRQRELRHASRASRASRPVATNLKVSKEWRRLIIISPSRTCAKDFVRLILSCVQCLLSFRPLSHNSLFSGNSTCLCLFMARKQGYVFFFINVGTWAALESIDSKTGWIFLKGWKWLMTVSPFFPDIESSHLALIFVSFLQDFFLFPHTYGVIRNERHSLKYVQGIVIASRLL